jgi:hypothetical protein
MSTAWKTMALHVKGPRDVVRGITVEAEVSADEDESAL